MTEMTKTAAASSDHAELISALVRDARAAQAVLAQSSHDSRVAALANAAALIRGAATEILARNGMDVARAGENGISAAFIDRLTLTPDRVEAMAAGLEDTPTALSAASWRDGRRTASTCTRSNAARRDRRDL